MGLRFFPSKRYKMLVNHVTFFVGSLIQPRVRGILYADVVEVKFRSEDVYIFALV